MNVFILMLVTLACVAVLAAYSKTHIAFKTILIPAIIFSSILSFLLLQEYLGKPTKITSIPSEITVYGQVVDKENELIYMLFTNNDDPPPAKYTEMVYTENLAKALALGKKQGQGSPFKLKGKKGDGKEEGGGKEGEGKKDGKKGGTLSLESATFSVHKLPPIRMPLKD